MSSDILNKIVAVKPEEVAAAVRFLAGPGARYITGTTLHVSGGAAA